jgi:hypothetical protein
MISTLAPTEAQLSCVKDICDSLHIEEPYEFTRKSYSDFISKYHGNNVKTNNLMQRHDSQFIFWN